MDPEPVINTQKENENEGKKKCQFYVERKRRQCKFQVVEGSKFCAAHCIDQNKIQCPYEKGMMIAADKFEKHLLNCPKVKNREQQEGNIWFNKGVNLKEKEQEEGEKKSSNISQVTDIDKQILSRVIGKVVKLYVKQLGENSVCFVKSTQKEVVEGLTNDHTQAHLLAQAGFNVHLIKDDIIYIQFGAGKGILSYHIAKKVKEIFKTHSKNVLLEREARRNKFDRFMKDNHYFQRYKSDVSDFDVKEMCITMVETALAKKPTLIKEKEIAELNDMKIVGICKHMCGGALDISVRALMKTKMSGCLLASCCHHLCSLDTYLNNQFFFQQGFSAEELTVLFKISSWGTKTSWISEEDINFEKLMDMVPEELLGKNKVIIGRMCKRLIDTGRAKILNCEVSRYCSDQLTPENFVIISQ